MKDRIPFLDMAKGFGMMLIIIGHTPMPKCLESWIWSFHVPIFFVISGYFFKIKPFKQTVVQGWKRLILPLLITYAINYLGLLFLFYKGGSPLEWMFEEWTPNVLFMVDDGIFVGMWFLASLFYAKLWLTLFHRIGDGWMAICSIGLFLIATLFSSSARVVPWFFLQGMASPFFVYCGYWMKKRSLLTNIHLTKVLWCIVAVILLSASWAYLNVYEFIYPYGILSVIGSIAILVSVLLVFRSVAERQCFNIIGKVLSYIGRNSMLFLCIHSIIHTWQLELKLPLPLYTIGITECIVIAVLSVCVDKLVCFGRNSVDDR